MPISKLMRVNQSIAVARWMTGSIAVCAVFAATAQETIQAAPSTAVPAKLVLVQQLKVGEATHRLLALQASGVAASDKQYPMPVAVAEKVYQRYVDSFSHPIAEKTGSALEGLE